VDARETLPLKTFGTASLPAVGTASLPAVSTASLPAVGTASLLAVGTACLLAVGTASLLAVGLLLSCSRGGDGREDPGQEPEIVRPATATRDAPGPGGDGAAAPELAQAPGTLGTGVLVCDKYIRMVCGCAQKRQSAALQRSCNLARLSLPEWKKSHNEEDEELAVVKACQRAFLYIQSTGQCDDVSY
jgi:hypothetical protein